MRLVGRFALILLCLTSQVGAVEYEKKPSLCEKLLNPNLARSSKLSLLTNKELKARIRELLVKIETRAKDPSITKTPVSLVPGRIDDLREIAATFYSPKDRMPFSLEQQTEQGYARLAAVANNLNQPNHEVMAVSVDLSLWPGSNIKVSLRDVRPASGIKGLLSIAGVGALTTHFFSNGNVGAGLGLLGVTVLPAVAQLTYMIVREPNPTFLNTSSFNDLAVDEGDYLAKGEVHYLGLGRTANHADDTGPMSYVDALGYEPPSEAGRDFQKWLFNSGLESRIAHYFKDKVLTPLAREYGEDFVNVEVIMEKTGFKSMRLTLIAMRRNLPR